MSSTLLEFDLPLTDDVASSYTLPSRYYLSPEIFELEKEKIFYRTWQYVAHQSMLPGKGDYVSLRICDQNIFVIRTDEGVIKGFYNVCQHRAHELLEGAGNVKGVIVCPYHAWTYKTDGSLMAARMGNKREDFDKCRFSLKEIKVEIFCGCIFVNLDPDAHSLASIAGDLERDIRTRAPYIDDIELCGTDIFGETRNKAGWKVVVDNYLECYHCANAHPDFASLIDMSAYQVEAFDYWSRQVGAKIKNQNTAYDVDPSDGNQFSVFWFLWPNTTFNILPGARELSVFAVRPTGLDSCSFGGHSMAPGGAKFSDEKSAYTSNILVPEDIALCESVQRGLNSKGYDQGPFIYDADRKGISEHGLHHFHRLVQQALQN